MILISKMRYILSRRRIPIFCTILIVRQQIYDIQTEHTEVRDYFLELTVSLNFSMKDISFLNTERLRKYDLTLEKTHNI